MGQPSRKSSAMAIELGELEGPASGESSSAPSLHSSTKINRRISMNPDWLDALNHQEEEVQSQVLNLEEPDPEPIGLVGFTEALYHSANFPMRDFDEVHVARDGNVLEIVLRNEGAGMYRTYKSTILLFTEISSLNYTSGQPDFVYAASEQQLKKYEQIMTRICEEWERTTTCLRAVLSGAGSRVLLYQDTIPRHLLRSLSNLAEAADKLQRDVIVLVDSCDLALEAVQSWSSPHALGVSGLGRDIEATSPTTGAETLMSSRALEQQLRKIEKRIKKIKVTVDLELVQTVNTLIQRSSNIISIDEAFHAREIGLSMKRLSWVTFIFLPLLFIASLYGMNVDVLKDNPAVWTYAVMAVCTFLVVMASVSMWKNREWLKKCFRRFRGRSRYGYRNLSESADEEMQEIEKLNNPPRSSKFFKAQIQLFRKLGMKRYMHHLFRGTSDHGRIQPRDPTKAAYIGALFQAIRYGNERTVRMMISKNKDLLNAVHYNPKKTEISTIMMGSLPTLRQRTPITQAAFFGQTGIVRYLLELGVSVNSMDGDGCTALHCFALGKAPDIELLRLLLEWGAVVNIQQFGAPVGLTPLNFLLLFYGFDVKLSRFVWMKLYPEPLHAETVYKDILKLLLNHGAWLAIANPPSGFSGNSKRDWPWYVLASTNLLSFIFKFNPVAPVNDNLRVINTTDRTKAGLSLQSAFYTSRSIIVMGLKIIKMIYDEPEAASLDDDSPSGWVTYKQNDNLTDIVCRDLVTWVFKEYFNSAVDDVEIFKFDSIRYQEQFGCIEIAWDRAVASQTKWMAKTQRVLQAKDFESTSTTVPDFERYMWRNNVLDGTFRHLANVINDHRMFPTPTEQPLFNLSIIKSANVILKYYSWNPSTLSYSFSRELMQEILNSDSPTMAIWITGKFGSMKTDWAGGSLFSLFLNYAEPNTLEKRSKCKLDRNFYFSPSCIISLSDMMMTPLIYSACLGRWSFTQSLLENGADLTARTNTDRVQDPDLTSEWTALELAKLMRANPRKDRPRVWCRALDPASDEDYDKTIKVLEEYEAKRQAALDSEATKAASQNADDNEAGGSKSMDGLDDGTTGGGNSGDDGDNGAGLVEVLGGGSQATGGPTVSMAFPGGSDGSAGDSGADGLGDAGIGGAEGAAICGALPVGLESARVSGDSSASRGKTEEVVGGGGGGGGGDASVVSGSD